MNTRMIFAGCALAVLLGSSSANGQFTVLFEEDFEGGGAAAGFTTIADPDDEAPASTGVTDVFDAAFAFTDLGIVGDVRTGTGGRFLTENALTAFVNGVDIDGSFPVSIRYDLYADPASSGSTEYSFVGVGDGTLPFQNYLGGLNGTEQTQGVFAGGLTDSDTAGSGDYVILEGDGSVGEPTELFDADAAANAQNGTPFALILPGGEAGPSGEGTTPAVLQHQWVTVELLVTGNDVIYSLDGQRVAKVTASSAPVGSVGFGIGDPFPSTNQGTRIPTRPDTNIIIDNIVITQLPEPTSILLSVAGLAGMLGVRNRRS